MKESLISATKEALRVVVLAIIPVVISGLESDVIDWRLIAVTGAITFLRFVDKLLHEIGKESDNQLLTKGLTRF